MAELLIYQTYAIVIGFIIDFFVGDPHAIPHPVVATGKLISFLDKTKMKFHFSQGLSFSPYLKR